MMLLRMQFTIKEELHIVLTHLLKQLQYIAGYAVLLEISPR